MFRELSISKETILELEFIIGCDSLYEWIQVEAENLAKLGQVNCSSVVKVASNLLKARNIVRTKRVLSKNFKKDACIESTGDGNYEIKFNPMHGLRQRERFSLAHEVGHTYFFEKGKTTPVAPLLELQPTNLEHICDAFARSLLIPRRSFYSIINYYRKSTVKLPLELIPILAETFDVLEITAARRMIFDFSTLTSNIICISERNGAYSVAWSYLKNGKNIIDEHLSIPITSPNRVIDSELIPECLENETTKIHVDGKLKLACTPMPKNQSSIRISKYPPQENFTAYVTRVNFSDMFTKRSSYYIAF